MYFHLPYFSSSLIVVAKISYMVKLITPIELQSAVIEFTPDDFAKKLDYISPALIEGRIQLDIGGIVQVSYQSDVNMEHLIRDGIRFNRYRTQNRYITELTGL